MSRGPSTPGGPLILPFRNIFIALLGLALPLPAACGDAPAPVVGVALPLHYKDPAVDYDRELSEIAGLGARWVNLVVATRQARVDSSEVPLASDRTPPDSRILDTIRRARELGLSVLIMPIVLLVDAGPDDWRGSLAPADREAWWRSYERFVVHMAALGSEAGAEALCVGSELSSLEGDTESWTHLIAAARTVFGGRLTYSANWDHVSGIGFWDQLDFAGMTAYFELTTADEPTGAQLRAGWASALTEIQALAETSGLQVVLTEIGIPSLRGAASAPWDYTRDRSVDVEIQRASFEAFEAVLLRGTDLAPGLGGFFLYDWWGKGGPDDRTYTARGKPAEVVWRRLLKATRPAQAKSF